MIDNTNEQSGSASAELHRHDALTRAFPATWDGRILFAIALAFSVFQIATAAHLVDFASQIVRAVHVGFVTVLVFPLLATLAGRGTVAKIIAWVLLSSAQRSPSTSATNMRNSWRVPATHCRATSSSGSSRSASSLPPPGH